MNNYWDGNGKYQNDFDKLYDEHVPMSGECEYVAGEMLRAASRLNYDFYNNGMGNNTSGAVNFLFHNGVIDKNTFEEIYYYTRGRHYSGQYGEDSLHTAMVKCVDMTIEYIKNNPETLTTHNTDDIFDFSDEEENFCEECGATHDGSNWVCDNCEEQEEYY